MYCNLSGAHRYLHWEGTVRNVHMSKSEVDALAFEILQRKQLFDRKRDKTTSLQSYLPTFFREKFGNVVSLICFCGKHNAWLFGR